MKPRKFHVGCINFHRNKLCNHTGCIKIYFEKDATYAGLVIN